MTDIFYPNFVDDSTFQRNLFDQYYRKDWDYDELTNNLTEEVYNYYCTQFENHVKGNDMALDEDRELDETERVYRDEFSNDDLKRGWMRMFNSLSFYNETVGEMLFYSMISVITKRKHIPKSNGSRVNLNTHTGWIQNSRSGKDQGLSLFYPVFKLYNEKISLLNMSKPENYPFIKYFKLDGHETVESLVNTIQIDRRRKKNEQEKHIKGLLETCDVLLSHEASVYYLERRGDKQTKSETLLQALEGRPIYKKLVSFEGKETITKSNIVFVAASRPISNLKNHIVSSGFQQRCLNYMRDITIDDRKRMQKRVFMSDKEDLNFDFNKELELFVSKLVEFTDFVNKNDLVMLDECKEMSNKSEEYFDFIEREVSNKEHAQILESFVGNFDSIATSLAYNNAYSHFRKTVSRSDYEVAYNIIDKEFRQLTYWIEDTIEVDYNTMKKETDTYSFIKKVFRKKPVIEKAALAKLLQGKFRYTIQYAYRRIKHLQKIKIVRYDETNNVYIYIGG